MQLYYCNICGQRINHKNLKGDRQPFDAHGNCLCDACELLVTNRVYSPRPSSRRNKRPEEKRMWLAIAAAPVVMLTFGAGLLSFKKTPTSAVAIESRPVAPRNEVVTQIVATAVQPTVQPVVQHLEAPASQPAKQTAQKSDLTIEHAIPVAAAAAEGSVRPEHPKIPKIAAANESATPAPKAPVVGSRPASIESTSTASAASADSPVKTGSPAEAPKAAHVETAPANEKDAAAANEAAHAKAYARLLDGDVESAVRCLESLGKSATIDEEIALIRSFDTVAKAVPEGLTKLDPQRPFMLRKVDGTTLTIGAAAHRSIVQVKDDAIEIEEKAGGASMSVKLPLSQISAQSRYEIAALSLPGGPANDLSLAYAAFVFTKTAAAEITPFEVKARIAGAKKDAALTQRADRVLALYTAASREQCLRAAMQKIEATIKTNRPQARSLLNAFKKDFADSISNAEAAQFIERSTFALAEVKQGLWASYYTGDEQNPMRKYVFSREETKLEFNWGDGSPDKRIPPDCFGSRFHGILRVTTAGVYQFHVLGDDSIELSLDGKHVVAHSWAENGDQGKDCTVKLSVGDHELKVTHKEIFVLAQMSVKWKLEKDAAWQSIPESALWYDPKLVEQYQKDVN